MNYCKDVSILNQVNIGSDQKILTHRMVVNTRIEGVKKIKRLPKPNLRTLKTNVDEFHTTRTNKFEVIRDLGNNIDEWNTKITEATKIIAI